MSEEKPRGIIERVLHMGEQPKVPVIIAGPHRVAKSETLDMLEELYFELYERGTKHKYRIGGPWPTDGQKKDSLILKTEKEGQKLIKEGRIIFDYRGPDTWHLVDLEDALRTDKFIVYISDVHDGFMKGKQFFESKNINPITFLFYTHPVLIETRLKHANIPDVQIAERLREFKKDFTVFRDNVEEYLFPIKIEWPVINSDIVLNEASTEKQRKEVEGYVNKLVQLVKDYSIYLPQSRDGDYMGVHHAYINDLSRKLVSDLNLGELKVRLSDKKRVEINLQKELKEYTKSKTPLPMEIKEKVKTVEIIRYQKANGRYSLWLNALVEPYDTMSYDIDPEDVVLDLIEMKLGKPTKRKQMKDQGFEKKSNFGQVNVGGAVLRDGALYSLGDPLITDYTHPPLVIGFLSTNGSPISMYGFTAEQITIMRQYLDGNHNNKGYF